MGDPRKGGVGRTYADAPEIDGQVIIANAAGIKPGDKVSVTVTASDEYDLFAEPVRSTQSPPLETVSA